MGKSWEDGKHSVEHCFSHWRTGCRSPGFSLDAILIPNRAAARAEGAREETRGCNAPFDNKRSVHVAEADGQTHACLTTSVLLALTPKRSKFASRHSDRGLPARTIMQDTISIYDAQVKPFFSREHCCVANVFQRRRPVSVVVDGNAPFVPRFLEQAVDGSVRKEVGSRVQGRHLLLQNQSRARAQARTKKDKRKQGTKVPRLRPESWRLPNNETK